MPAGFASVNARYTRANARYARLFVWGLLFISWLAMLLLAWNAFTTVPSAERLAESHMEAIPTLSTMLWLGLRSAAEVALLMLLLWPWSSRRYATRAFAAALLLPAYFLFTTPLSLTGVEWVHRRWLAVLEVVLLGVWAIAGIAALKRPAAGS